MRTPNYSDRKTFCSFKPFQIGLSIVVLTGVHAFAEPLEQTRPNEPVYLMPISAHRDYEESVQKLLGSRWGDGTMIYEGGSYSDEDFVVSVWGPENKPKTLTLIRFQPDTAGLAKAKWQADVPIDAELADAIYKAWCAMLLKTRYPDKLPVYADASTAEFSAWISGAGGVYGKGARVPGFQKELMEFGFELRDYCSAKEEERKAKRESMIPRLRHFAVKVEQSRLY